MNSPQTCHRGSDWSLNIRSTISKKLAIEAAAYLSMWHMRDPLPGEPINVDKKRGHACTRGYWKMCHLLEIVSTV
jgi:hypothetical protein